jgi:spore germination cell wall hydrolase CwlJ-like protein
MNKLLQLSCNILTGFCVLSVGYLMFYAELDAKPAPSIIPVELVEQKTKPKAILLNRHSDEELECLALNIYHEARGESILGQEAIAWVTLNRVKHEDYPNTICGVVKQAKYSKWWKEVKGKDVPLKNKCHFSWYCDGVSDEPKEQKNWEIAQNIAFYISTIHGHTDDPTQGAIMYHADYVNPYWATHYQKLTVIDTHIFYGEAI